MGEALGPVLGMPPMTQEPRASCTTCRVSASLHAATWHDLTSSPHTRPDPTEGHTPTKAYTGPDAKLPSVFQKTHRITSCSSQPTRENKFMLSMLLNQFPGFKEVRLVPRQHDIVFVESDIKVHAEAPPEPHRASRSPKKIP